MNNKNQIKFSLLVFLLAGFTLSAQQTKTYKESFDVGDDAILEINTSHADITFETWNKNQVVVEATITLEGASEEEAEAYFEDHGIEIMGNSERIEVSTTSGGSWAFRAPTIAHMEDFHFEMPDMDFLHDIQIDLGELAPLPPMPPMPPLPAFEFDYDAYKKDGENYLKEWKEQFKESYDDEYKARWEEWSQEMKERFSEWEEQHEERKLEREKAMAERAEEREKRMEERRAAMEERRKQLKEERDRTRAKLAEEREKNRSIFYHSFEGDHRDFKIKKSIRIKMPKSTKLKMNVRHGEVKLAAHTNNVDATLSYARLLATTIDGDKTRINASYTPVLVEQWNYGDLNTQFSETVTLEAVKNLNLMATSSNVTIDRLDRSAVIRNDLGALRIHEVAPGFDNMDIQVQNGEILCALPETAFVIDVSDTYSKINSPKDLVLTAVGEGKSKVLKGYRGNKNASKTIKITARYSDVAFQK